METLAILHRDEHLVAVDKPSGLLVHRSALDPRETRFGVQLLRDQLGRRVYPVHRLDRGTSGVLLFALDGETAGAAGRLFAEGRVEKTYWAVVRGHPPEEGVVDHPLARTEDDVAGTGAMGEGEAREAVTRFRTLAACEIPHRADRYPTSRYALMEMEPLTGRRHQLRRHMKHLSHPILGDATWGKGRHNRLFRELFGVDRLLLACVRLRLPHPVTGEPLCLEASPGEGFLRVVRGLGWEVPWTPSDGAEGAPRS